MVWFQRTRIPSRPAARPREVVLLIRSLGTYVMGGLVEQRPRGVNQADSLCGSQARDDLLLKPAHLGERGFGIGPVEVDVDRLDPEIAQGRQITRDIGVIA